MLKSTSTRPKGYTYAMTSPAFPGVVKIGRSLDVGKRMSSANTFAAPSPFTVLIECPSFDDVRDERDAHRYFAAQRRSGEFFLVSHEEVRAYFQQTLYTRYLRELQERMLVPSAEVDAQRLMVIKNRTIMMEAENGLMRAEDERDSLKKKRKISKDEEKEAEEEEEERRQDAEASLIEWYQMGGGNHFRDVKYDPTKNPIHEKMLIVFCEFISGIINTEWPGIDNDETVMHINNAWFKLRIFTWAKIETEIEKKKMESIIWFNKRLLGGSSVNGGRIVFKKRLLDIIGKRYCSVTKFNRSDTIYVRRATADEIKQASCHIHIPLSTLDYDYSDDQYEASEDDRF
jgi:hypothetical protein